MLKWFYIAAGALRTMWRFRLRSILTLLSAMLGVSGVIASVNYAEGGRRQVLEQIRRMGTNVLVITPQINRRVGGRARTGSPVTTLVEADYAAIRREVPSIVRASATVSSGFLLKAGDLSKNTPVVGCEPDYFRIKNWNVADGELFEATELRRSSRVALIGYTVAQDLFGTSSPVGERLFINRVPFEVVGVLAERGQGLDVVNEDNEVFVPLTTARHRLLNIDYFSSLLLEIDRWDNMSDASRLTDSILRQRHRVSATTPPDFQVQNQKTLLENQTESSERLNGLVRTIGLIGLVVSGLGTLAMCWISVKERTVEIGTRRALGATKSDVFFQILFEAALVSSVGCLIGLGAGSLATSLIAERFHQPFIFEVGAAEAAVAASFFLNLCFSAWPAGRASGVNPIRALKYE
jgi:putative ABC transport system permease protein